MQLYPNATELITWLLAGDSGLKLSDDLETPTFYQSLAGVTHREWPPGAEPRGWRREGKWGVHVVWCR